MKRAMFTLPFAAIALMLTVSQSAAGAQDSGSTTGEGLGDPQRGHLVS